MTTTKTEHGAYEHGKSFCSDRCWMRTDKWTSNDGRTAYERLFAAGRDDDSPIYRGHYNGECTCCYLNHSHTTAAHEQRITRK